MRLQINHALTSAILSPPLLDQPYCLKVRALSFQTFSDFMIKATIAGQIQELFYLHPCLVVYAH